MPLPVQGPDNCPRKVEMVDNGDGTYTGRYTPDDCGQYKVHVRYGGKEVAGSPVPVQAVATGHVSTAPKEGRDMRRGGEGVWLRRSWKRRMRCCL